VFFISALLLALASISTPISAADKAKNKKVYSDMWVVDIDLKQSDKFEQAFKKHIAARKKAGDPRNWEVYSYVIGSNLNRYAIRHCCIEWADQDSYDKWSMNTKLSEHWQKHVAPYVSNVAHYMYWIDFDNSQWPQDNNFQFFTVYEYYPAPGAGYRIGEFLKQFKAAADAQKWTYPWSWSWRIGDSSQLLLVIPSKNWAGFAEPDPSFMKIFAKHVGSEDKAKSLMQEWAKLFKKVKTKVVVYRKDLSLQK
jgi:hypothetical protein